MAGLLSGSGVTTLGEWWAGGTGATVGGFRESDPTCMKSTCKSLDWA